MAVKKEKKEKSLNEKKPKEKKGGSLNIAKLKNYFNKNILTDTLRGYIM